MVKFQLKKNLLTIQTIFDSEIVLSVVQPLKKPKSK